MGKFNILFSEEETTYLKHKPYFESWKKKRQMSDKIRRGVELVIAEEESKKQKKIENFVNIDKSTLEALPPIWDHLTRDDLSKLEPNELFNLYRATQHNAGLTAAFMLRKAYGINVDILGDQDMKNWLARQRLPKRNDDTTDNIPLKS